MGPLRYEYLTGNAYYADHGVPIASVSCLMYRAMVGKYLYGYYADKT
jgi:hypothetical protein